MSEMQQVSCPKCAAVGAGPRQSLYFCHVCPEGSYLLPSENGKIISNWLPDRIKELEKQVEELKAALIIRVEEYSCPECSEDLNAEFGHSEDCKFFKIEQEAQP